MQISINGIRAGMLVIGIILVASLGKSTTAVAADNEKDARDIAYLEQIITVLRTHVLSMRAIIAYNDMKYADNMVRHANAFERTIDMVGPMDWHAAKAFEKARRAGTPTKLTEAEFEKLARASNQTVEAIKRAANRYMRDKNGGRMNSAMNNRIKSCGAWHSRMAKGGVRGVWKGMGE